MIDPLYLMIYLVIGLILVIMIMCSAMIYMIVLLKGILKHNEKVSTNSDHFAAIDVALTNLSRQGKSGNISNVSSTGSVLATFSPWSDDTVEANVAMP